MMALEPVGAEPERADVWVGAGPCYPWGGLYGGQIVAQALRSATFSVDARYRVHSLHAYFIRPGDHTEPIRFEVDRVRDGGSFCTRRVTARQSVGVILNLAASYQADEPGPQVQTPVMPELTPPGQLPDNSWSETFERRVAPRLRGEVRAWARLAKPVGDDPALQACALAYISDDFPTEAVVSLMPDWDPIAPTRAAVLLGQPRPCHLVPPPTGRGRLACARLHLPRADQLPWGERRARVHPGRHAPGHRHPGGAPAASAPTVTRGRPTPPCGQSRFSTTATPFPGFQVLTYMTLSATETDEAPSRSTSKASNDPTSNR